MEIRFLHRNEIDTARWDDVVSHARSETLYPYAWYLDVAAVRWSALVVGEYQHIMPLVWQRRFGFRYLYQPFYTQQLGVFSREEDADSALIPEMLSEIRRRFSFGTLQLNALNPVTPVRLFLAEERENYVLDLQQGYDQLSACFSNNTKRNLKKAAESGVEVFNEISCAELVAFKRANDVIQRSDAEYRWLTVLLETIQREAGGTVLAAKEDASLLAAAFFGFSRSRAIYLLSVSSEAGKERRSMFRILDAFIREHAGTTRFLDFEGSTIPSVARFFAGFGAKPEIYYRLQFSNLPFIMRRLRGEG